MIASRIKAAASLKDANRVPLLAALSINFALFILVAKTDSVIAAGAGALAREWQSVLPAGLGLLIAGLAAEQLTPHVKACLVFWKWRAPLPGCEAFSRWMKLDARVNAAELERKFGPFPSSPAEQNAHWYGMYRSVGDDPAVTHTHRLFLLARDYTAIAVLIAVSLGPAAFLVVPSTSTVLVYQLLLVGQYLFARQAARNSGIEFVCTVLALKSHE